MGSFWFAFFDEFIHFIFKLLRNIKSCSTLSDSSHSLYAFSQLFWGVFSEETKNKAWRLILNWALDNVSNVAFNWAQNRSLRDLFSVAWNESQGFWQGFYSSFLCNHLFCNLVEKLQNTVFYCFQRDHNISGTCLNNVSRLGGTNFSHFDLGNPLNSFQQR